MKLSLSAHIITSSGEEINSVLIIMLKENMYFSIDIYYCVLNSYVNYNL